MQIVVQKVPLVIVPLLLKHKKSAQKIAGQASFLSDFFLQNKLILSATSSRLTNPHSNQTDF